MSEDRTERRQRQRGGRRRGAGCDFCNKVAYIDYKDVNRLRNYISGAADITAAHDRHLRKASAPLAEAIKRARHCCCRIQPNRHRYCIHV